MWILSWLKRRRRELDLDEEDFQDEIRAHLAIAAEEKMADGADRQDARYAALQEFGNVTLTTEAARRVWTPALARGAARSARATSATRSARSPRTAASRSPSSACSRSASA